MTTTEPSLRGVGSLTILCGLPGSGKTTFGKQLLEGNVNAVLLSPDEWMKCLDVNLWDSSFRDRTEKLQLKLAGWLMLKGVDVVLDWGSWGRSERDELRMFAGRLNADVHLVFLDASDDTLFERITARGAENPAVTLDRILLWRGAFQPPDAAEKLLYTSYQEVLS